MRILYVGNVANVGYMVAKEMRKIGVDVDLLMHKNPVIEQDPNKQDPELKNSYPTWIHFYDKTLPTWRLDVIKKMRDKNYKLIYAHYGLVIFAYLSRRPFIAQPLGNDLRTVAFEKSIRGILMRLAYKRAKAILFTGPEQYQLLNKLKLKNIIFLPIFLDFSTSKHGDVPKGEFSNNFVIFHPTNLWSEKGNSILVEGFAKFVKENPSAILLIVDRGPDSAKIHQLVTSLGIQSNIRFIKGPLTAEEMRKYYHICDVVADQFITPELGGIGREALLSEKPLVTHYDEKGYRDLYGQPPPALNASTPTEVQKQLEYVKDEKIRKEIGKKGKEWLVKYHSPEIISKKIKCISEAILNSEKINQINDKLLKIT